MDLTRLPDNRGVCFTRPFPDLKDVIRYEAVQIRREKTGIHATASIALNQMTLGWSQFNIERDGDRGHLVNGAFRVLESAEKPNVVAVYPREYMKHEFDEFCRSVWPTFMAAATIEPTGGVYSPVGYLIEPVIVEGGGTVLFAPPGRGKTYVGLAVAVSADAGLSTLFAVKRRLRVLIVNLERSERSLRHRIALVNKALDLPEGREILIMNERGKSLIDIADPIEATIAKYNVELLIVDSLTRAGFGDLNENKVGNSIIDTLNRLAPQWLGIAHTPRMDESHIFGSQMFDAGADLIVRLSSETTETEDIGVGLTVVKANDVPTKGLSIYRLSFQRDIGLTGFTKARPNEFPSIVSAQPLSMSAQIREYLLDVGSAPAEEIAEALGKERSNMSRYLASDTRFFVLRKDGSKLIYAVKAEPTTPEPKEPPF
jgi:hypothetical protein